MNVGAQYNSVYLIMHATHKRALEGTILHPFCRGSTYNALIALQLLKHERMYRLFCSYILIFILQPLLARIQYYFTPNFHTHSEVAEISIVNILNAVGRIRTLFP